MTALIKIYTTPKCEHCLKAKKLLKSRNLEYEEIDLSERGNRSARKYYRSLGLDKLPIITVIPDDGGERVYKGWLKDDLDKMRKLLSNAR